MKLVKLAIIMSLFLTGCKESAQNKSTAVQDKEEQPATPKDHTTDAFSNVETIQLPFMDSTNFDNFKENKKLTDSEVDILKLKTINQDAANFFIRYKVPFSNTFRSVVVTYQLGEFELVTMLINYDTGYHIIDKLDIAYDEIAESQLRKQSLLEKNSIKVEDINWFEETSAKEAVIYEISPEGKIIAKK